MANLEEENLLEDEGLSINRNSLTVLVTGILVIIAGFVVYSYFSRVSAPPTTKEEEIFVEGEEGKEEGGIAVEETTPEGTKAEEAIEGSATVKEEEGIGGPEPGVEVASTWVANNIEPNTISDGSYTVNAGDTLWEIAEGRYGSGFEWTKILDANKDSIGFLPNGSQALIRVGQELTLPD